MKKTPADILNELIPKYETSRDFARAINEHASDLIRWRYGKCAIKMRAVISICRLHPEIKPHELNDDFPADLRLVFENNPSHMLGRKMDKIVKAAIDELEK